MALITADRVYETSVTTGAGAYTLAGAKNATYQAFSAVAANGDTAYYTAFDNANGGWEIGLGTWGTGGTLTRTTVIASSNANAAVSWAAGTREIFLTETAKTLTLLATLTNASVSIASAATTDIGVQNTANVEISGTTTITSFGTNYNGPRFLRFTGALVLTHSTALNLPGAANITTAVGDTAIAIPNQGASGWNVVNYQFTTAQTVSSVVASRALGTTYTNTTNKPIEIGVTATGTSGQTAGLSLTIAGVLWQQSNTEFISGQASVVCVTGRVYPGETYVVSNTAFAPASVTWAERR